MQIEEIIEKLVMFLLVIFLILAVKVFIFNENNNNVNNEIYNDLEYLSKSQKQKYLLKNNKLIYQKEEKNNKFRNNLRAENVINKQDNRKNNRKENKKELNVRLKENKNSKNEKVTSNIPVNNLSNKKSSNNNIHNNPPKVLPPSSFSPSITTSLVNEDYDNNKNNENKINDSEENQSNNYNNDLNYQYFPKIENDNNEFLSEKTFSLIVWEKLLLEQPSLSSSFLLVDHYSRGLVNSEDFFNLTKLMIMNSKVEIREQGIFILNEVPCLKSFIYLAHHYNNYEIDISLKIQTRKYLDNYLNKEKFDIINLALKSNDKIVVVESINMLKTAFSKQKEYIDRMDLNYLAAILEDLIKKENNKNTEINIAARNVLKEIEKYEEEA